MDLAIRDQFLHSVARERERFWRTSVRFLLSAVYDITTRVRRIYKHIYLKELYTQFAYVTNTNLLSAENHPLTITAATGYYLFMSFIHT